MNQRNLNQLKTIFFQASVRAGFNVDYKTIHLEKTKTLSHGHFSSNLGMLLAGYVGKKPQEVAASIISFLDSDLIEKAEVAGPGFINIHVRPLFYTDECRLMTSDIHGYLRDVVGIEPGSKTMVTDSSHPNIAKPMGIHHLLSTIIGDSLIKIYRSLGWKVISDNYIGDWGTQFGKLIYAIKTWGDQHMIDADPIPELLRLYVKFHDEAEKNPELEAYGRAEFKKLEDGDPENRELWRAIVKLSFDEFKRVYERLKVHYDVMNGESFYEDKMPSLLESGRKKGIFVDGENGAWIVPPDDLNDPPALIKKSDGATLYLTRDLAQMAYWEEHYHPDVMLWVVDVAQSLHFKQRFQVSKKLRQTSAELIHAHFGRMQFKDGGMSTRKGNILKLEEVLDEAEERAMALVQTKGIGLPEDQLKELARIMGIGSLKYNVLSQNRIQNITFDWDRMLSFEGNSAPYLMYTAARAKSVFRKAELFSQEVMNYELDFTDDREVALALDLMMYPDAVKRAADEFKPNHVANHLYHLAQQFNAFYNDLSILKADHSVKNTRLLLTASVLSVMEHGLGLLGIEVPEKM